MVSFETILTTLCQIRDQPKSTLINARNLNCFSYIYDASKRIFNVDKGREMKRVSELICSGETVVDMYAG